MRQPGKGTAMLKTAKTVAEGYTEKTVVMADLIRIRPFYNLYKGLPREIYFLFFARLVNSAGNFIFPFLTLYLTRKLNYTASETGLFIFYATISYAPGALIAGKVGDTIGKKPVIVVSQYCSAVLLFLCAIDPLAYHVPYVIIGLQFSAGAVRTCINALAADLTSRDQRQSAFSLLYIGLNIGFSIGPLLAGLLFNRFLSFLFWGEGMAFLLSASIVFFLVNKQLRTESSNDDGEIDERGDDRGLLPALISRPHLLVFSVIAMILEFVYAQHNFSLPLQLTSIFDDAGSRWFGVLMTVNAVTVIFFTPFLITVTKGRKPISNMIYAGFLYMAGFGMLFFCNHISLFVISTFLWTCGEILATTNQTVYITNHSPRTHRARFNSVLPLIILSGFSVGPLLIGPFIDSYSVKMVWPMMVGIALIAIFSLSIFSVFSRNGTDNKN